MAKGQAMGIWRGKKGSSVFYRLTNSTNAQKQGIRERVYEPSNPRSSGQAGQRMKLLPAQRFATMFSDIIERAFEGVPYGVKSRQKFLSYALKMQSGFPAMDKGDARLWPGRYLVSSGTLPAQECAFYDSGQQVGLGLSINDTTSITTLGDLSRQLILSNIGLQKGDQLTLLLVAGLDGGSIENTVVIPGSISIYLDPTSTAEWPTTSLGYFTVVNQQFRFASESVDFFIGAALVISRESESGKHLRSLSYMAVNPSFDDFLFSEAAKQRARRSYQNQRRLASDWELVPGSGVTVDEESELQDYTIAGTSYTDLNGKVCKVWRGLESGNLVAIPYLLASDGTQCLVSQSGQILIYETPGEGGLVNENNATPSDVPAFNGIPTVIYQP